MNNKASGPSHSEDRQLVSHRIIGSNYFTQTEQSVSDQDDVRIEIQEISSNCFIKRSNIAGRKAVNGSANQNLPNSNLKSELTSNYYAWRMDGTQLSHAEPGLQGPGYCYDALAAEDARYQTMTKKTWKENTIT